MAGRFRTSLFPDVLRSLAPLRGAYGLLISTTHTTNVLILYGDEYDSQIISHKLKTLRLPTLTSSIITVEGCGLTIAHAYLEKFKSKLAP